VLPERVGVLVKQHDLVYEKCALNFLFHGRTVHLDIIGVLYLPNDTKENCFKKILKFTLKQLRHVSV
jgi:hypothetical protein